MRKIGIAVVALSAVLSASAWAEDWTNTPVIGGSVQADYYPSCSGLVVPESTSVPLSCPQGSYLWYAGSYSFDTLNILPGAADADNSLAVFVQGFGRDPGSSITGYGFYSYSVPLAAFARAASVQTLATRVSSAEGQLAAMQQDLTALATFIPEAMQEMQQEARAGAAMAASLETVAPAPGSKNRLGFNSANYNGETAFSISYVRQEGQIDVSAGVAISGDEAMVKGGVGLSW